MIRIMLIIAGLFAIAVGFEWLKDTPGKLALTYGGVEYSVGLAQAAIALAVIAVISVIVYLIIRIVWTAPGRALFAWRGRKDERGRQAISRGLLAIAAGDLRNAELSAREAAKRAPNAPLTALLQAQAAQLKGERDTARNVFTAMLEAPETRIAGLHGLFIEAEREGALEAAQHYARTARETQADTAWAARALLKYQAGSGDWDEALATLATAANNRSIDKKTVRNHRAVLLTAKAMAGEVTDAANAKLAALEAHQLAPDLVPAAIIAGRILGRAGEIKRAAKVLETSWKASPHPELADAYAHVRSGDSALDRMARMERLLKLKPHNDEGRIALAEAAMEAREWQTARDTLKPVITTRPTRNALLLMADLDEAEHGDRGRVREWLDRAVRAPRDPVWTADGAVLDEWSPVSPVTGRIGAVEWKVPVEDGDQTLAIDMEDEAFKPRDLLPPAAVLADAADAADIELDDDAEVIDVTPAADVAPADTENEAVKPGPAEPAPVAADSSADKIKPEPDKEIPAPEPAAAADIAEPDQTPGDGETRSSGKIEPTGSETATIIDGETEMEAAKQAAPDGTGAKAPVPANGAARDGEAAPGPAANDDAIVETAEAEPETGPKTGAKTDAAEDEDGVIVPPVPDDPGVDEADDPEPRRFKLF